MPARKGKTMKGKAAIALLFSAVFAAGLAIAADKVKVGTFSIPALADDSSKGVFVELAGEIAKRAGLEFDVAVLTPQRANEEFRAGNLDVLFPAVDALFEKGKPALRTKEIIYVKRDFVFTLKGSTVLKTMADLEGKTVGITQGYPYVKTLTGNKKIKIETAASDEENLKKLAAGKIAAYVVEEKTGLIAVKKAGMENAVQYDSNTPLSKQEVYFAVKNGMKDLAAKISKALTGMKSDASFSRIMSKAK